MIGLVSALTRIHDGVFGALQKALDGWFIGLAARLAFGSVLLIFFWNSAYLKVIDVRAGPQGVFDYLTVEGSAFGQMAPAAFEAANFNASNLGIEYWLMAYGGTYAEFILPLLIVIGLFTRLASVAMIGFLAVMTWVDLYNVETQAAPVAAKLPALEQAVADAEDRLATVTEAPESDLRTALDALSEARVELVAAEAAVRAADGPDARTAGRHLRAASGSIETVAPALRGAERRAKAERAQASKALTAENNKLAAIYGETIGAPFDNHSDGEIWDQRLLWIFLLLVLIVRGAGAVSLDGLLRGLRAVRGMAD